MSRLQAFSQRAAVAISDGVGTMTCALAFTVIALISLPAAIATRSILVLVSWFAQTLLQLVLLSILGVGTRLASDRVNSTIVDTHALAVSEHEATRQILAELADSHRDLHQLVAEVHALTVAGGAT